MVTLRILLLSDLSLFYSGHWAKGRIDSFASTIYNYAILVALTGMTACLWTVEGIRDTSEIQT